MGNVDQCQIENPELKVEAECSGRSPGEISALTATIERMLGTRQDLETLDDETVMVRLCQLRGVGQWTAEYVLLRGLGRIHIFPGNDAGARKSLLFPFAAGSTCPGGHI